MKTDGKVEESFSKGKDSFSSFAAMSLCFWERFKNRVYTEKNKFINVGKLSQIFIIAEDFFHNNDLSQNAFVGVRF